MHKGDLRTIVPFVANEVRSLENKVFLRECPRILHQVHVTLHLSTLGKGEYLMSVMIKGALA